MGDVGKKMAYEQEFDEWVNSSASLKKKYGGILEEFDATYDELSGAQMQFTYLVEAGLGIEIVWAARQTMRLVQLSQKKDVPDEEIQKAVDGAIAGSKVFYKNYYLPIDRRVFVKMLESYRNFAQEGNRPAVFDIIESKYKGDIRKYADDMYDKSMFASEEKVLVFLKKYKKSGYKKILKNPAYQLADEFLDYYRNNTQPPLTKLDTKNDSMMRIYMKAQIEMEPDKRFYPDANSTLRISYGKVKPYFPREAAYYVYQTTLKGIMEKEDPYIYDYVVEDKLKELYKNEDYGI